MNGNNWAKQIGGDNNYKLIAENCTTFEQYRRAMITLDKEHIFELAYEIAIVEEAHWRSQMNERRAGISVDELWKRTLLELAHIRDHDMLMPQSGDDWDDLQGV